MAFETNQDFTQELQNLKDDSPSTRTLAFGEPYDAPARKAERIAIAANFQLEQRLSPQREAQYKDPLTSSQDWQNHHSAYLRKFVNIPFPTDAPTTGGIPKQLHLSETFDLQKNGSNLHHPESFGTTTELVRLCRSKSIFKTFWSKIGNAELEKSSPRFLNLLKEDIEWPDKPYGDSHPSESAIYTKCFDIFDRKLFALANKALKATDTVSLNELNNVLNLWYEKGEVLKRPVFATFGRSLEYYKNHPKIHHNTVTLQDAIERLIPALGKTHSDAESILVFKYTIEDLINQAGNNKDELRFAIPTCLDHPLEPLFHPTPKTFCTGKTINLDSTSEYFAHCEILHPWFRFEARHIIAVAQCKPNHCTGILNFTRSKHANYLAETSGRCDRLCSDLCRNPASIDYAS